MPKKATQRKSKATKGQNATAAIAAALKLGKTELSQQVKGAKKALANAKLAHKKELAKVKALLSQKKAAAKGPRGALTKVQAALTKAQAAANKAQKELAGHIATHAQCGLALKKLGMLQKWIAQFEKAWKKEAAAAKQSIAKATTKATATTGKKRGRKAKATAGSSTTGSSSVKTAGKKRGRKPKTTAPAVITEVTTTEAEVA